MECGDQCRTVVLDHVSAETSALPLPIFHRVIGDSMRPEYEPGDVLLVDPADNLPTPPGVFLLAEETGVELRRLQLIHDIRPQIVLVSCINKAYQSAHRRLDKLRIVGRVRAKWVWT